MRRLAILFLVLAVPVLAGDEAAEDGFPVISTGKRVELKDHLERGKFVLFSFYADWSSTSRKWDPIVARFAKKYPRRIVVKRINIKNWGTPVAIQYHLKNLPYSILYAPNGKRKRKGHPRDVLNYLERQAKKW